MIKATITKALLYLWAFSGFAMFFSAIISIIFVCSAEPDNWIDLSGIIAGIFGFLFFAGIFYAWAES